MQAVSCRYSETDEFLNSIKHSYRDGILFGILGVGNEAPSCLEKLAFVEDSNMVDLYADVRKLRYIFVAANDENVAFS